MSTIKSVQTVRDLKEALANVPDEARIIAAGPDGGGYDWEFGHTVSTGSTKGRFFIWHNGSGEPVSQENLEGVG